MEEASGIAALGINLHTLIVQTVNFFILFGLLWLVAYKPILKVLNERRNKITESMALADKTKKESEELELTNQQKISQTKEDALKIIAEAKEQIKNDLKDGKSVAENEAKKIVDKAKTDAENERKNMIKELKGELAGLIVLASGKLTKNGIKVEVQKQLVDEMIVDLEKKEL